VWFYSCSGKNGFKNIYWRNLNRCQTLSPGSYYSPISKFRICQRIWFGCLAGNSHPHPVTFWFCALFDWWLAGPRPLSNARPRIIINESYQKCASFFSVEWAKKSKDICAPFGARLRQRDNGTRAKENSWARTYILFGPFRPSRSIVRASMALANANFCEKANPLNKSSAHSHSRTHRAF